MQLRRQTTHNLARVPFEVYLDSSLNQLVLPTSPQTSKTTIGDKKQEVRLDLERNLYHLLPCL